jgi:hypothetical protein
LLLASGEENPGPATSRSDHRRKSSEKAGEEEEEDGEESGAKM